MLKVQRTSAYDIHDVFQKCSYTEDGFTLRYRLYVPKNSDCGEKVPLLVFLHGAGERGDDNEKQLIHGLQDMFNHTDSPVYDSIVFAPQCGEESQWVLTPWEKGNYNVDETAESRELEMVCRVIDSLTDLYNIDEDRVYVTGLSMGGFGTWDLLARHGSRFAAGMPVCGGGDPDYANLLKRIPIRTFHGSEDGAVPVAGTRAMFAAIRQAGGEEIGYTEFDGAGHGIWGDVYSDPENIQWLYAQSREERRKKAEKKDRIVKIAAAAGSGLAVVGIAVLKIVKAVRGKKK